MAMHDSEAPQPLSFPVPFLDIPTCLIFPGMPSGSVANLLGPPMLTDWVDGFGETDFWAFEYSCGLQVAFQILQDERRGVVFADSPDIEHVLRHIPCSKEVCEQVDDDYFEREVELLLSAYPERQKEIDALHSFQV